MLENLFLGYALPVEKVPNAFIVVVGLSVVFIGLILIILNCKILSALCSGAKTEQKTEEVVNVPVANTQNQVIENRQEIIAAVCAAAAEEMGTDISGIRVLSFKKI